jgi:hypothetical protein
MVVKGWDYVALVETYEKASKLARESHTPILIHVRELTQPQGHSTSGSHERYKSEERLAWERAQDCNLKFREWIVQNNFATSEELEEMESEIKKEVRDAKKAAWTAYTQPMKNKLKELLPLLEKAAQVSDNKEVIEAHIKELKELKDPLQKDLLSAARKSLRYLIGNRSEAKEELVRWTEDYASESQKEYSSHLYSQSDRNVFSVKGVKPEYADDAPEVDARIILRDNFDHIFATRPETLIFGEDTGEIGDVNQGLEGLQEKYGKLRVADVGIREATILGQGIGMAMRGLRPIAEIQYLDYVLYALQLMSDDLATLQYRTKGRQKAPLIVRTRGHRLEGIWHSGSQMGALVHLLRGMHILVPRHMTKAAAFYNTLPERDEVDARIVAEIRGEVEVTGNGIIDSQSEVGGWPEMESYPAPTDTDNDGMPDEYESENGLDPEEPYEVKSSRTDLWGGSGGSRGPYSEDNGD